MPFSYGSAAARDPRRRSPSLDGHSGLEDLFQKHIELEEDVDDETWDVKPLFFDEEVEADYAAMRAERMEREAEKKKREEEERKREAEDTKREEAKIAWRREKHKSVINSIREFDRKSKTIVWTRFPFEDFSKFDLDEESAIPPMRHTAVKYEKGCIMYWSANILSIKIVSSDVGFPINVYGTVIARDSLDSKCIYLFRCNRRDSQFIKTEGESLILVGPSRGFILQDFIFLEVNLKIKIDQGKEKTLSKGLLQIDGRVVTRQDIEVRTLSHASWYSKLEVHYIAVKKAVEATIEFRVLQGDFCGKIKAHTTSIPLKNKMLLYHSNRGGVVTSDGGGTIQLWRPVVTVSLHDMLLFTIVTLTQADNDGTAETPIIKNKRIIEFTPKLYDADQDEIYCGSVKFHVKVTWSLVDRSNLVM